MAGLDGSWKQLPQARAGTLNKGGREPLTDLAKPDKAT